MASAERSGFWWRVESALLMCVRSGSRHLYCICRHDLHVVGFGPTYLLQEMPPEQAGMAAPRTSGVVALLIARAFVCGVRGWRPRVQFTTADGREPSTRLGFAPDGQF